ncbi:hypothetical protein SDC9_195421 [bioreactor metagenome]|uniref:Uncharacterized protein n=1 Tax=bioreactor metagenome TaxID=1076179 RepID=A0A645I901_9ZZZZ
MAQDGVFLVLPCRDYQVRFDPRIANLSVYALHHRFRFALFVLQQFQELLGADIVGQWPQTFTGST